MVLGIDEKMKQRYEREQRDNKSNRATIRKLKKLQRTVIAKLQEVLDGEDIEAKVIQACTSATNLLKQNRITVDPDTDDAVDPVAALLEDDDMVLPTNR
jgi:hypothetical protein